MSRTLPVASLFAHEPLSPCASKPEVGYLYSQRRRAIATLYSANPVPALSISGPAAKKSHQRQQENMAACGRQNIHHHWGGGRWLRGNCGLFVRIRQCCVCLLLRSLASWPPLHGHRTGIMDSQAVGRKSAAVSCALWPQRTQHCFVFILTSNAARKRPSHTFRCPAATAPWCGWLVLCRLLHLDRSCRD